MAIIVLFAFSYDVYSDIDDDVLFLRAERVFS
jgi:hypothetical protein